jgi:hypothetical protein
MLRYQNGGLFSEQSFEPPVAGQMFMYREQPCVVDWFAFGAGNWGFFLRAEL